MAAVKFDWDLYHRSVEIAATLETKYLDTALRQRHALRPEVVEAYMDALAARGHQGTFEGGVSHAN